MSCTTIPSDPVYNPGDYSASGGDSGSDAAVCTALSYESVLPTPGYSSGGGYFPTSGQFFLTLESGAPFLLIGNSDGVAGTDDDRKLFLA